MFTFDFPSEMQLEKLNPSLVIILRAAGEELAAQKIYFRIAQGLRTYQNQDELYALGRTVPNTKIVTNARGGFSNHNFGCAVDCYPFVFDEPEGPLVMNNIEDPKFTGMVKILRKHGLAWGGTWSTIKDYPHFQLASFPVTPTNEIRNTFATKGITAVWEMFHD